MHPRCCLLLFVFAGSKKCTRDVSEVTAVLIGSKKCVLEGVWLLFEFVGSKKCSRDSVGCSLCLRVQKNIPAMLSVTLCVRGFKKIYPRCCWLLFVFAGSKKCTRDVSEVTAVFMGSKKCTRNSVGCFSSLWVQKNVPAIVFVAPRVCGFKKCTRGQS